MATWFRTKSLNDAIECVEVVRSAPACIWIKEKSWNGSEQVSFAMRSAECYSYFETRAEAVKFLRDRLAAEIKAHETAIADRRKRLEAILD